MSNSRTTDKLRWIETRLEQFETRVKSKFTTIRLEFADIKWDLHMLRSKHVEIPQFGGSQDRVGDGRNRSDSLTVGTDSSSGYVDLDHVSVPSEGLGHVVDGGRSSNVQTFMEVVDQKGGDSMDVAATTDIRLMEEPDLCPVDDQGISDAGHVVGTAPQPLATTLLEKVSNDHLLAKYRH